MKMLLIRKIFGNNTIYIFLLCYFMTNNDHFLKIKIHVIKKFIHFILCLQAFFVLFY